MGAYSSAAGRRMDRLKILGDGLPEAAQVVELSAAVALGHVVADVEALLERLAGSALVAPLPLAHPSFVIGIAEVLAFEPQFRRLPVGGTSAPVIPSAATGFRQEILRV